MTEILNMRTSERHSLKHCSQQWYWSQVEGLRPNRSSTPLWFGSAVHEALAAWYLKGVKRGPHPAETFVSVLDADRSMLVFDEDDESEYVSAIELGTDMLNRYVEEYGQDESWDVIAVEQKGSIILSRPEMKIFGQTRPKVARWMRYNFTWDGVYRDLEDGQIKLMEHKTAASIVTTHLPMDDQAGSYWAIANRTLQKSGVLGEGDSIVGINYNFLRKALADTRPRNADGHYTNKPVKADYIEQITARATAGQLKLYGTPTDKMTLKALEEIADSIGLEVLGEVSKVQPPAFFERHLVYRSNAEREKQIRRIQDEGVFAEAYRKGFLPLTKTPDKMACNWCQFKRMCELDEQGDQYAVEAFKETMFHIEDPYTVYKKGTE